MAGFECTIVENNSIFKPYCEEPFESFEVDEIINDIEIVNDSISINNGEFDISFDQAIIIKTENKTIMFSKNIWFSEDITITEHDDYNSIFPISQVVDSWTNDGENIVKVIRNIRTLQEQPPVFILQKIGGCLINAKDEVIDEKYIAIFNSVIEV